ncbi:SGNH/GDSL hydrolase family protein [Sulfitobacter albidus]|uniref:SGNH/GDSL hydrolase family protein n=1 Tax=Sulfitobacter albidus TaxID=2829501 RepID=A0A975PLB5_9RHOB|nr:SGNH/GDSL hydrolase family protein [Sulfitobacter albidus]QUJ75201.1 SGNH/GDSL hydrolase family protein [Sulfitobacter albidus]
MRLPAALTLALSLFVTPLAAQEDFVSPDILILGDSQIPFGSGPVFLDFFKNIKTNCAPTRAQQNALAHIDAMKVAVIGVRSTSLHSWTARAGRAKGAVCDVDPKWKVNAGTYGIINRTGNKYAQIGRGRPYQFCQRGQSPFEAMFAPDYYAPKLLLMSFLGNSSGRWADSRERALADVQDMMEQVPPGTPCIFMTTSPSFSKKVTDRRLKAQENIKWAFEISGASCSFVEGATARTIAANQGNRSHFRRAKSGKVKDIYHPNERAARKFFSAEMDNICAAVLTQLSPVVLASNDR